MQSRMILPLGIAYSLVRRRLDKFNGKWQFQHTSHVGWDLPCILLFACVIAFAITLLTKRDKHLSASSECTARE